MTVSPHSPRAVGRPQARNGRALDGAGLSLPSVQVFVSGLLSATAFPRRSAERASLPAREALQRPAARHSPRVIAEPVTEAPELRSRHPIPVPAFVVVSSSALKRLAQVVQLDQLPHVRRASSAFHQVSQP